ncbi:hypothetical protein DUI87_18930 [Hirundo rustica rustica]|uniref:Uncharacterized protein n=1 Tax=Hirundo rustica rustica TaxID=333673 RepID=A0A3M0JUV1_HIRRU|nr:hypothetical protein DUI87_18930 [Hirundo rustica rustica]
MTTVVAVCSLMYSLVAINLRSTAYSQGKMTLYEEKYWLNLEKLLKGILVAQKWKTISLFFSYKGQNGN